MGAMPSGGSLMSWPQWFQTGTQEHAYEAKF
jgi:hypothetical protein